MSQTPTILIVPGWRDSGPGNWQSLWAESIVGAVRVQQDNWISPTRSAWVSRIAETIQAQDGPVVLVAHSLGCIASTHLPPEAVARIQGALLVAPADPERRAPLVDFAPVPYQALPFRSVVVASSNDPYCPVRTAGAYARSWGSESDEQIIEAQIPASQFYEQGFTEGEALVLTPRKARVFVA